MSFKKNDTENFSLFSRYAGLSERDMKFLEKSPLYILGEKVFPKINESRFSVLYSDHKFSRPNTPVNVVVTALIIKEMLGLTDEELLESVLFDLRVQYALHTLNLDEQPFSDRTLSRFRERLAKYEMETGEDLLKAEIMDLSAEIAECMNIKGNVKRMDSLMISSHCKKLSRLQLFYTTIAALVKRIFKDNDKTLGDFSKFEHYLSKEDMNNTIYRCKSADVKSRLNKVAKDAVILRDKCAHLKDTEEYKHLCRLIDEQISFAGDEPEAIPGKEVSPTSMQNPTDPDATFRRKAGVDYTGYVGNVVESMGEDSAIITQFDYQANNYSDSQFCKDVVDEMGKQSEQVTLVADGAYFSQENVELAAENNIELVTTTLTGQAPEEEIADFVIDKNHHQVLSCPAGKSPTEIQYNEKKDSYKLVYEKWQCAECPNKDKCKAKLQKDCAVVRISEGRILRAQYKKKLSDAYYKKLQKLRNGVEGVPSILRRRYTIDSIPAYGLVRSKLWFTIKICTINITRFINWLKLHQEGRQSVAFFILFLHILHIFVRRVVIFENMMRSHRYKLLF